VRAPSLLCLLALAACDPPRAEEGAAQEAPTQEAPAQEAPAQEATAQETPRQPPRLVREDRSDLPIAGLTAELATLFALGDGRFEEPFTEAQGLGPLYIQRSCVGCHEDDLRGPGVVRRFGVEGVRLPFGDTVRPQLAAGAHTPLAPPEGARVTTRLPPAVIGRGQLEALPDAQLFAWAEAQAQAGGPISGRVARHRDEDTIATPSVFGADAPTLGRFGLKARTATLEDFVADALLGDMGLTSPTRVVEPSNPDALEDDARPGLDVDAETVVQLAAYVRLLAIPTRATPDARGERLFSEIGCADCHVPRARTRADHPIEALRDREVALYTDVLLHDMGAGLEDGIEEAAASGREWRTAPLVGLRFVRSFLHDGRAGDVATAIAAHASDGSEASEVLARFEALEAQDREALVRFVEGL
jgi:CxxC motif-containing protein (DUF1111 family)